MNWVGNLAESLLNQYGLTLLLAMLLIALLIVLFVIPKFKEFFKQLKDVTGAMKGTMEEIHQLKTHNLLIDEQIKGIKEDMIEAKKAIKSCVNETEIIINKMVEGNEKAFTQIQLAVVGLQDANERIRQMITDLNNDLTKVKEAHAQLVGEHIATHKNLKPKSK